MQLSGSLPKSDEPELDIVVGLGANLGDRLATLRGAARRLRELGQVVAESFVYETAPLGPPQPHFYNAAARLRTHLAPEALLAAMLQIERDYGRERRERWGPRSLDLDLLWAAGTAINLPTLVVPHPELARRAFALVPLLDVAADATEPGTGRSYRSVLAALNAEPLQRVEPLATSQ